MADLLSLKSEATSMDIPDDYKVSCSACKWEGSFKECGTEEESDGWEYPTYMISVCPECGTGIEI